MTSPTSFSRSVENSVVTARAARRPSKRITLRQASNMMAAVRFAREIGTPLDAHATIHWLERMVVTILTVDASQNYVQASTSGSNVVASL